MRLSGIMACLEMVGLLLSGGSARARERGDEDLPGSRIGVALEAGGGVQAFRGGQLADVTQVGGDWNVRLLLNTRWYIGAELAYVGSANKIGVGSLSTNATLIGNGIEGAVRIQVPIPIGYYGLLEPYVLGGLGWTRYDLSSSSDLANMYLSGDNGLSVPVGGGLLFGYHHFLIDLRANYHFGFYNNPVRLDTSSGTDNWDVNALIGYEF